MSSVSPAPPGPPEPAWEIARLFPAQGHWSEGSYLSFTEGLNQLVELVDGRIEVLETPTKSHQKIVQRLLSLLLTYLTSRGAGDAISAPYRIRLRGQTFREPDIVVYLAERLSHFGERYGDAPDLVMEVVSSDTTSRARDYEDKRRDYAEAGISEYWIVDPAERRILILSLQGATYTPFGNFSMQETAMSKALEGFSVDVSHIFDATHAS